jgi:hypothetical protein
LDKIMGCDTAHSIVIGYGLDGQSSVPNWGRDFSLHHRIKISYETSPASYLMSAGRSFPEGKAIEM